MKALRFVLDGTYRHIHDDSVAEVARATLTWAHFVLLL